jgi:hypothetical protein
VCVATTTHVNLSLLLCVLHIDAVELTGDGVS